jgi:hypothetical protein
VISFHVGAYLNQDTSMNCTIPQFLKPDALPVLARQTPGQVLADVIGCRYEKLKNASDLHVDVTVGQLTLDDDCLLEQGIDRVACLFLGIELFAQKGNIDLLSRGLSSGLQNLTDR